MAMLDASVSATHNTTADTVNTGTFKATCTNGTAGALFAYTSGKLGLPAATTFTMTTGGATALETIKYALYPSNDATGTALVEAAATAYPGFLADGIQKTLNLSVKILADDKVAKKIGTYTDTVTIDVTFGTAG